MTDFDLEELQTENVCNNLNSILNFMASQRSEDTATTFELDAETGLVAIQLPTNAQEFLDSIKNLRPPAVEHKINQLRQGCLTVINSSDKLDAVQSAKIIKILESNPKAETIKCVAKALFIISSALAVSLLAFLIGSLIWDLKPSDSQTDTKVTSETLINQLSLLILGTLLTCSTFQMYRKMDVAEDIGKDYNNFGQWTQSVAKAIEGIEMNQPVARSRATIAPSF
jgi:hypothetical protein